MQQETLRVLPNPYTFIDADGEPQGAYPADPSHHGGKRMWIGAKLDPARTKIDAEADRRMRGQTGAWKGDDRPSPQTTKFVFVTESITIPLTAHYLDGIRTGALLAADEESYRKAFGTSKGFLPTQEIVAEERAQAAAGFFAERGRAPGWAESHPAETASEAALQGVLGPAPAAPVAPVAPVAPAALTGAGAPSDAEAPAPRDDDNGQGEASASPQPAAKGR